MNGISTARGIWMTRRHQREALSASTSDRDDNERAHYPILSANRRQLTKLTADRYSRARTPARRTGAARLPRSYERGFLYDLRSSTSACAAASGSVKAGARAGKRARQAGRCAARRHCMAGACHLHADHRHALDEVTWQTKNRRTGNVIRTLPPDHVQSMPNVKSVECPTTEAQRNCRSRGIPAP